MKFRGSICKKMSDFLSIFSKKIAKYVTLITLDFYINSANKKKTNHKNLSYLLKHLNKK